LRDVGDAGDFGGDLCWSILVLEAGAASEDAGVVGATDDDVDALGCGGRHQTLQRVLMVKQRVAALQQGAVRLYIGEAQGEFDWFGEVYAQAPALDDALLA
jgi:hypothetical protein